MHKDLLSAFYALAELSFGLKDNYLISRLKTKNLQLLGAFLDWQKETNVAQSKERALRLNGLVEESIELVDLLRHLKVVSLSPALIAIKHLLSLRLGIAGTGSEKKEKPAILPKKENIEKKVGQAQGDRDLGEIILTLLRYRGKCYMREIAYALKNNFSARTIQRHLQQMTKSGQIIREIVDGYPKYSIKV